MSDYRIRGVVFAALAAVFFSSQDALVKWLSGDFSLFQLLFVRSTIGVIALCVLIRIRFGWAGLTTRRPGGHLLRALSNLIAFLSYYFAITRMPLADAASLVLSYPLFLALLSGIFLGEHPKGRQVLALIAGFVGVHRVDGLFSRLVVSGGDGINTAIRLATINSGRIWSHGLDGQFGNSWSVLFGERVSLRAGLPRGGARVHWADLGNSFWLEFFQRLSVTGGAWRSRTDCCERHSNRAGGKFAHPLTPW